MNLAELCEPFPDEQLPELDRANGTPRNFMEEQWRERGYFVLPGFMPGDLIDAYCEEWRAKSPGVGGWPDPIPYMRYPALRELCCHPRLADILHSLIGEPMGVHLNLTGWVSTQRNWHQDGYLNPDTTADWYAAVWVALDDIHPMSGPFQYVPGSHRMFGTIRQARMLAALTPQERESSQWPTHSERILTPLFEQAIIERRLPVEQFNARKGDVLIWHARLLHRGSTPMIPNLERRAVIFHLSGIHHRPDMPTAVEHRTGGHYFPIRQEQPV